MTAPTIDEFTEYIDDLPRQSPCWGDGILGLYPVLSWLNTHPVVLQRELVAEKGVFFGVMMTARAHHNQVGTAVAWATQYMAGPPGPVPTDPDDLPELFDLAGRAYLMRNLLAESTSLARARWSTCRAARPSSRRSRAPCRGTHRAGTVGSRGP
jgi:hypothetical protein